jgi:hypothetical protein
VLAIAVGVTGIAVPVRAAQDATSATAGPQQDPRWESYGYEDAPVAPEHETAPVPRLFENVSIPADLDKDSDELTAEQKKDGASMQELEQKINLLRGQIQDTKSMIHNLGESVSKVFVTSTKLLVLQRNDLGSAFSIESVEYKLDGFTVYSNSEPKKISANPEMVVFDASVLPGNHTLDAVYTIRGTGYGIFTYMKEYRFDLRNQYYFSAPRGKAVELVVEAMDQGTGKTLRDRPVLKFRVR